MPTPTRPLRMPTNQHDRPRRRRLCNSGDAAGGNVNEDVYTAMIDQSTCGNGLCCSMSPSLEPCPPQPSDHHVRHGGVMTPRSAAVLRIALQLAALHPEKFGGFIAIEASDFQPAWYDIDWFHRPDAHGGEMGAALVSANIWCRN